MSANQTLRDQMYGLVEQWRKEGGVQKAFCDKHGVSVLKFQYWHKRYKDENILVGSNQSSFIKMDMAVAQRSKRSCGQTEVIFPNGIRILLDQDVSVHFLKALL